MKKSNHHSTAFINLYPRHCEGCWQCIETCPHNVLDNVAILWHQHAIVRNADQCKGCMKCVSTCPCGAITPIIKQKEKTDKVA